MTPPLLRELVCDWLLDPVLLEQRRPADDLDVDGLPGPQESVTPPGEHVQPGLVRRPPCGPGAVGVRSGALGGGGARVPPLGALCRAAGVPLLSDGLVLLVVVAVTTMLR